MSGFDGPRTTSLCKSFRDAEARAREVLKARGVPDDVIEHELNRAHRDDGDFWGLPWWEANRPAEEVKPDK